VPVPCTAWSNPTVRGLGAGVGCWEASAVACSMPLAEVRAVCARLGPLTVVGADSQADVVFFLSSRIFNP
jgi:hypothetical protein